MNNAPQKKKDLPSNWTFDNWIKFSILDWLKVLKNQLPISTVEQLSEFQNFFATTLYPRIKDDPDELYQNKFRDEVNSNSPNWRTNFNEFKPIKDWKINEFRGISFWLAFPLFSIFDNQGFASLVVTLYDVITMTAPTIRFVVIQLPPHIGCKLLYVHDITGTRYIFSYGKHIATLSYWLPLQLAFLLYSIIGVIHRQYPPKFIKSYKHLTWYWGETIESCELDVPPTYQDLKLSFEDQDFYRDPKPQEFLKILGEVYSQNSLGTNNLYIWLQCVIRSVPKSLYQVYGYQEEIPFDTPLLKNELRLVAAMSKTKLTSEVISKMKSACPRSILKL